MSCDWCGMQVWFCAPERCVAVWPSSFAGTVALVAATVGVCLMETFTHQIDNLVVPLYYFAMVQLASLVS